MEQLFLNFVKRIEEHKNIIESVCYSTSEGVKWSKQFFPLANRNIYSHSKSFTSLMVGIAIDEKMLTLDTHLVEVFKDEISEEIYNKLFKIKVRHLLTMSSGFDEGYLMGYNRHQGQGYPDYLKFMFNLELKCEPGSKFCYSNGDTYLLSRIIEKVYKKSFYQLCYEKIFLPLEMGLPIWGCDPNGYSIAASDLHLNVIDMNKLGILFLNKGVYKGKRIVSEEYVNMCVNPQIKTQENYWGDYSFQFWMIPEGNGYRADGAYGQMTLIWPQYDIAFSFQRPEDDRLTMFMDILREEVLSKL